MTMSKETKEERFVRVAEKRVQNVISALRSLSQCANRKAYGWSDDQLARIWSAIDGEVAACKESFENPDRRVFKL